MRRSASATLHAGLTIVAFAVAFFILQRLTFSLRFPPFDRTTIWIPGALTFAGLLLSPMRDWWRYYVGLCLGATLAYAGDSSISAGGAFIASQFHFLAVALTVRWVRRLTENQLFNDLSSLLVFWIAAGVLVPVATTTPLDVMRWLGGASDVIPVFVRSVLCVSLGLTIAVPAIVLTFLNVRTWIGCLHWRIGIELILVSTLLLVVTHLVFTQPADAGMPFLIYGPVPLLLWIALRLGLAGNAGLYWLSHIYRRGVRFMVGGLLLRIRFPIKCSSYSFFCSRYHFR